MSLNEIKEALEVSRKKNHYIGDDHHSETIDEWLSSLVSKVEGMQKALEFYADEATYDIDHLSKYGYIIIDMDRGEIARQALKGVPNEQSNCGIRNQLT